MVQTVPRQAGANIPQRLAVDTEDDSEGTPTIINFFDGWTHMTFTRRTYGNDLQLAAWNWLTQQAPAVVWACNLEYDLINLCGPWVGKMVTLSYRGEAGLLKGSWRDSRIQFFDTLRHWPMTVEQMGRYLGLPKLAKDFTSVTYCRRDTEIVWRFVTAMLERYDALGLHLKTTLPGMALQLFARRFFRRPWPEVGKRERDFFRRGYYGGRVEVYRFGLIDGPIYHYDVNSLFPSVMRSGLFPNLEQGWSRSSRINLAMEGMADVTVRVPPSMYPPLPVRSEYELVYPYGTVRGVWCYPELRAASMRGVEIIAVHEVVEYEPMRSPFVEYVDYCYGQRRTATHTLDNVFWKLMMNSLYGKFGQGEGLTMIYQDREFQVASAARQANVIWAAYVTALARVRLLDYLERARTCYYTDTDSLFTPRTMRTSKALGALKHEGTAGRMQCLGNKLYVLDQYQPPGGTMTARIIKAKGIPHDAQPDFIRTGRAIFRKPVRYRESRKSFAQANVWLDVEKERERVYTKRKIHADGTTEAWDYREYRRRAASGTLGHDALSRRAAMPG